MQCSAVVCVDLNWGISKDNSLPWKCPKDMDFFKKLAVRKLVAMGRKTWESISPKGQEYLSSVSKVFVFSKTYQEANWESFERTVETHGLDVLVCGGQEIYQMFFERAKVHTIYITKLFENHDCDRRFVFPSQMYNLSQRRLIRDGDQTMSFDTYTIIGPSTNEDVYLSLLSDVLLEGKDKPDRTGVGTKSLFGKHMEFDLRMGFPLLTTKKMFWKGVVEELLFFLRGETQTKQLEQKGIKIWKGNTTKEFQESVGLSCLEEGDMGKMYGYQWRRFNDEVDQIQHVIDALKKDPNTRRSFVTAWNPCQLSEMVLPPCHVSFQLYVDTEENMIDMHMYQRSADMFLGVPFNMASYGLLLCIIGTSLGYIPRKLRMSFGDVHVYQTHVEQAMKQLNNKPYAPPVVNVSTSQDDPYLKNIKSEDIHLMQYTSHGAISAPMAV